MTPDIQDRVEEMVKESVNTWLPYLSIDEVVVEQLSNRLNVDVKFSLKNDMTAGEAVNVSYAITE